jgi:hypothetical protein
MGLVYDPKGLSGVTTDMPRLTVFYSSGNQQDVPRSEKEFLVDKNEARNSKICVRV